MRGIGESKVIAMSEMRIRRLPGPTVDRWERAAEWPLTVAALVFIAAYAAPIIDPALSPTWVTTCEALVTGTWALFAFDYAMRLGLATARAQFVRKNLFDLAVIALPMLRPLRLLRMVVVLSFLQRRAASGLIGHIATYVVGGTILLVFSGALAITDAERGAPESNIGGFADGLWWAIVSVTTVGYGDRYPVTAQGRLVAVGLMIAGIALLGTVTATFAAWFVARVNEMSDSDNNVAVQVAALRAELAALSAEKMPASTATATEGVQ